MRTNRCFVVVVVLFFVGVAAMAFQSNRFSGVWESQTNPGVVWTVDQSPTGVKVLVAVRGKDIRTTEWLFDGPPVSTISGSFPAQTAVKVDGEFLLFSGPVVLKDGNGMVQENWKLDKGGNELVVDTKISAASTTFSRQQVFHRHP